MKNKPSRRERGELTLWRVGLILVLGTLVRLLVVGYVIRTVYLVVTGGFDGWW